MNSKETTEVMHLLADTLRVAFSIAGIPIPNQIEPERDANALANAIRKSALDEARGIINGIPNDHPTPAN